MISTMEEAALKKLIEDAGGPAAIGAKLGITGPAVSQWKKVPALRALALSRLIGVPEHELRPDLYPPPSTPLSQAERVA